MAAHAGAIAHVRIPLVRYRQHTANTVGALQETGSLRREFQLWLSKGLRIKLSSYGVHRDLSQAFYQRIGQCTGQYDRQPINEQPVNEDSPLKTTNPFDPQQIDWGLGLLKLGLKGYQTNYCPAGITLRLWLGKFLADVGRLTGNLWGQPGA